MAQGGKYGYLFGDSPTRRDGTLKPFWTIFFTAFWRLWDDAAIPLAGNIAFRMILAIFPFLVVLTAIAGFIGDAHLASALIDYLLSVAPPQLVEPLVPEIRSVLTEQRRGALSIGILLTIWSASGGVDSVRVALNRAYGLIEHRSAFVLFTQNILFVMGGALMMLAVAFLVVLAPIIKALLVRYVPDLDRWPQIYDMLRYPFAVVLLTFGLTIAHVVLPATWRHLRDLWLGIVFTVVVWLVLAVVYSMYLANFSQFASTYAGLAGIIAALFFIYLGALVLIFGGELNRMMRLRRKVREKLAAEARQAT
ncbi:YihY/virulence factor BrkB family protein [Rhodoligotrophos defluvii]|uniref:YihY/virulence factor BrkB family protein n=1 Tax=Rhodoligotrophos defluvii TaxID=2561934 RepID=UPI0010C9B643|nr:YihY/virulence factor BrkB family protein [Rhodoligotrophos defluvii]